MIHRRALPNGVNPMRLDKKMRMTTVAGVYESGVKVSLQNIRLPELDKNRIVNNQTALVFGSDFRYDVILGSDFLQKSGIDIKYSTGRVEQFGNSIPLLEAPRVETYEEDFKTFIDDYLSQMEYAQFGGFLYDEYSASILDAKYEKVDVYSLAK